MRVIISAGGTGGHIYPALAIVNKIKEMEPDSDVLYIGTHNRMEKDIVPLHNIKYEPIEIYGLSLSPKLMLRNVKNVFLILKDIRKCKKIMKEFKPDVVIGVGGYVTYPVIKAANKLGIKTFIHEQNSIPGKANLSLAKKVNKIGISFKDSEKYFTTNNVILTGNPCSENALKIKKIDKTKFGLDKKKKTVLFVNGSLGSDTVNEKMIEYLKSVGKKDYEVLYITGKNSYENFKKNKFPKNVFIEPFIDNLPGVMQDVDLIVTRAGASSLSEITALQVPNILIPSPFVANNHQYYNAMSIVNAMAGEMIEEKYLSKNVLDEKIDRILNDSKKVKEMKNNLSTLCIKDSSSIIYNELKKLIKE